MTLPHKSSIGLNTISDLALQALNRWHEKHHPEEYRTTMPPINLYNIGPIPPMKTTRSSVLAEASTIVNGARADQYGGPEDSFKNIARLWSAYLTEANYTVTLKPEDIALMMTLLKVARLSNSPDHRDSWVDIAGYAACGAEIALQPLAPRAETLSRGSNAADEYAKGAMESAQSNQRFDSVWDALDIDPEENYTPPWDHRALDKAVSRFYNLAKESK